MQAQGRLDAELLKDGTVFKYIGQYIQANLTPGWSASNPSPLPTTRDIQSILQAVEHNEPELAEPSETESIWVAALCSFAPFKQYLQSQSQEWKPREDREQKMSAQLLTPGDARQRTLRLV